MFKRLLAFFCLSLAFFYCALPAVAEMLPDDTIVVPPPPGPEEPNIRVLLDTIVHKTTVLAAPSSTLVIDNFPVPIEQTSTLAFTLSGKKVVVKNGNSVLGTGAEARLVPPSVPSVTEIKNFSRPLKGHKAPYNMYRGTLSWRVSKDGKYLALINTLPLEMYLYGITETAPRDPIEYLKALIVAARSYAYVRLGNTRLPYDVEASTNDQLYLGYQAELRLPETTVAANATRGEVVYYNGMPVNTLYFSHSNGKTLSWDATHKDSRPWLAAVDAPYDKGLKRSGHGYGMSLRDARERAKKEAADYYSIITYYYSGTTVQSVY